MLLLPLPPKQTTALQGLRRLLWHLARGGLLLLLVGRPQQLVYGSAMRSDVARQQAILLSVLAGMLSIAAALEPKGVAVGVALLLGLSVAFYSTSDIEARDQADRAQLRADRAAMRAKRDASLRLADQLGLHSMMLQQAALDMAADAVAMLARLNQLQ